MDLLQFGAQELGEMSGTVQGFWWKKNCTVFFFLSWMISQKSPNFLDEAISGDEVSKFSEIG